MSFEYHHLDKFGYANLDLCEELLESEKKAIVLISGASSSGKSFSAEYLRELLERNGHHGPNDFGGLADARVLGGETVRSTEF